MHLAWSAEEAGTFVSSLRFWVDRRVDTVGYLKQNTNQKSHAENVLEVLATIRRFNHRTAKAVLKQHKSLKDVILLQDYNSILNIDGVGVSKIDALRNCFKGTFTSK